MFTTEDKCFLQFWDQDGRPGRAQHGVGSISGDCSMESDTGLQYEAPPLCFPQGFGPPNVLVSETRLWGRHPPLCPSYSEGNRKGGGCMFSTPASCVLQAARPQLSPKGLSLTHALTKLML